MNNIKIMEVITFQEEKEDNLQRNSRRKWFKCVIMGKSKKGMMSTILAHLYLFKRMSKITNY